MSRKYSWWADSVVWKIIQNWWSIPWRNFTDPTLNRSGMQDEMGTWWRFGVFSLKACMKEGKTIVEGNS